MPPSVLVIGAGFAGLSSALLLQKAGWTVTILEKNDQPGGRARSWKTQGYTFDMGPSWYLWPEVFERFFAEAGTSVAEAYPLHQLSTHYQVWFEKQAGVKVGRDLEATKALFETFEPGGAQRLQAFLDHTQKTYDTAMKSFLYREFRSVFDFFNPQVMVAGLKAGIFLSLDKFVRRFFQDRRARQILEYGMMFLGTIPQNAPALYSILAFLDLKKGIFFPEGGMNGVARAMARLFEQRGGRLLLNHEVTGLEVAGGRVTGVRTAQAVFAADEVVNGSDYAWSEVNLLAPRHQSLPRRFWQKATFSPSLLLVYLGLRRTLPRLEHHNYYFQDDWNRHFDTIFKTPSWPQDPCFYLSAITRTDPSMAPPGCENLFLLVPIAPGLEDTDEARAAYLKHLIPHVEKVTGENLHDDVDVMRVYGPRDFAQDYNAWGGTALGIANTLFQSASFRPSYRSKKLSNLWYAGQYTHPGVGVPPTLISAQVAVSLILKAHRGS